MLIDPREGYRRGYIGQSINPVKRYRSHFRSRLDENPKHYYWIRKLSEESKKPSMVILASSDTKTINVLEVEAIKRARALGWDLTNIMDGGNVPPNVAGRKWSDERKAKLSKTNTGRKFPEEWRKNISLAQKRRAERGWKHTEDALARSRAAHIGNKYSLGLHHSEEAKRKMSEKQKGSLNARAILTEEIVISMRRERKLHGTTYVEFGKRYGVNATVAHSAVVGRTWKHVPFDS